MTDAEILFNKVMGLMEEDLTEKLKPGFGFPGSKADQLEHILPILPQSDVFIDGFGGSGVVLMNRTPSKLDIYNDRCSGVTSFFRCMQREETTTALARRIEVFVYSKEEWLYCKHSWEDLHNDLVEKAARWFYTVHCSYACKSKEWGRTRQPGGGKFNTFTKIIKNFPLLHERWSNVQIECDHVFNLFKRYDAPNVTWYLDPTYLECVKNIYTHELSYAEHVNLLDAIMMLKGNVALSGYPNKLYDSYEWDQRIEWPHTKQTLSGIACEENHWQGLLAGDARRETTEVLWIRYAK